MDCRRVRLDNSLPKGGGRFIAIKSSGVITSGFNHCISGYVVDSDRLLSLGGWSGPVVASSDASIVCACHGSLWPQLSLHRNDEHT